MRTLLIGFITLFLTACNNPTSSQDKETSYSSGSVTSKSESDNSVSSSGTVATNASPSKLPELRKKLELENVVIFSHVVGKNTPKGKGAEWLKQKITKQGFLKNSKLQVYPNALLFNDPEVMSPLEQNKVQLAAPSISKLTASNSKLQLFDFPFLFGNIEEVQKFYNEAQNKLFDSENGIHYLGKDKKFIVLGLWHNGMKQISSNRDFEKGDKPLNSSKIRIQSSTIIESTFNSLGVNELVRDDYFGGKLKNALGKSFKGQAGGIDGQENTWSNISEEDFYQVQKYFKETNHGYLGYLIVTNGTFWNSLDDSDREKWKKMVGDVSSQVTTWANDLNKTAKTRIENHVGEYNKQITEGKKSVTTVTPNERKAWCEKIYGDNYDSWKEVAIANKELIEIAIKNKKGCPFDFFEKMISASP